MPDSLEETIIQARQGSMAAIIQVLNDRLADRGVRTRAVLQEGILQVLCEAPLAEPLEREILLPHVREILESIELRKPRRARISSRIAREQQLIWLEDIHRNPDSQLLWSESIILRRPSLFKRLSRFSHRPRSRTGSGKPPTLPPANIVKKPKPPASEESTFWRGLLGGVLLSALSFLLGWGYQYWRSQGFANLPSVTRSAPSPDSAAVPMPSPAVVASPVEPPDTTLAPNASPSPTPTTVVVPPTASPVLPPVASSPSADPFAAAVRLAEEGAELGQTASTAEQWQALARQWQQAAELMQAVSADDPRYATAQERSQSYQRNSEVAQQQAADATAP
ncbi:MAG: hypothetical protein HC910_19240 [Spirulinaceae cyanobacterium SM2_1_0]|nr:hypothetical protein [Spirulinaceae cyanobacterium SM2_1_0]